MTKSSGVVMKTTLRDDFWKALMYRATWKERAMIALGRGSKLLTDQVFWD